MSEHLPQRLLDFHLEHDPEARTVTVITITDQGGGEQVKHTVIGRYAEGDDGPTLTSTDRLELAPMLAEFTLGLSLRNAETHTEAAVVHRAPRPDTSAMAHLLRRRTPESRFAYLAEQRQEMVDRGADANELAVFDALAVAGWMENRR